MVFFYQGGLCQIVEKIPLLSPEKMHHKVEEALDSVSLGGREYVSVCYFQ